MRLTTLVLVALAVFACHETTGPTTSLPTGTCTLTEFVYEDTTWGVRLGPELSGEFILVVSPARADLATFSGHSPNGVTARFRTIGETDDGPDDDRVQYFAIVGSGDYGGVWQDDSEGGVWWSFFSTSAVIDWVSFAAWKRDGRSLVARWSGDGWYFDAVVRCL